MMLVGHGAGRVKGNLHVRAKDDTPKANILLTIAQTLGLDTDKVGDSTGTFSIWGNPCLNAPLFA